ncbi:MAG: hypothetical protein SCALA702_13840 [Melioribacteraceae bacterium]|nr:MAG: hypothetical protein SCALA702_13840 [Melioribacteraceae bacterium]
MKNITLFLTLIVILISSCTKQETAETILKKSVEAHGGDLYQNSIITYNFRDQNYKLTMDGWKFSYERSFSDSTGSEIIEGMDNKGAYKSLNGVKQDISEDETARLKYSINAARYFNVLPLQLINKAVVPKLLGEATIDEQYYYELEITFRKEGGGEDYQDRYILWIEKEDHLLEYFAYYYHVNGGGSRFREMVNTRKVGGLILSDQINYTSESIDRNIEDYKTKFVSGDIKKVSEITLKNLEVNRIY